MATEEEQAQLDNPSNIRVMGGKDGLQGYTGSAADVAASPYPIEITPSDSTTYDPPLLGLRVGTTAGDISVVSNGSTVVIPAWQLYESLNMTVTKVNATGTTAVGITGFQAKL